VTPATRTTRAPLGLTIIELLIALVITAMMGLAIGSMMSMVSAVSDSDRAERTALLRVHAGQVRLRAYMDNALCALQHDADDGVAAIWLYDLLTEDSVNLREIRLLTVADGAVTVEWVSFPDNWNDAMKDAADVVVPAGADFIAAIEAQRALGYTRTTTLLSDVQDAAWSFSDKTVLESPRARLDITIDADGEAVQALYAFGMKDHTLPE
jgi:hypothetical protein